MIGKLYKSDNGSDIVIIERMRHESVPDQLALLRFLDDRHIQHYDCAVYIHFIDTDEYYVFNWFDKSFIPLPAIAMKICKCNDISDNITIESILTSLKCINTYVSEVRKLNKNELSTIDPNLTFNQFTETVYCMISGLVLYLENI